MKFTPARRRRVQSFLDRRAVPGCRRKQMDFAIERRQGFEKRDSQQPSGMIAEAVGGKSDAQGRVQKIIAENKWTPEELVAELLRAAAAKP